MAPQYGRLLVPALLRPFGEHLAAIVHAEPGDVCVDVGCEGGVMPALLGRTARTCIATSGDTQTLDDARDELEMLHLQRIALLRAHADALPLRDGGAQVVTSLFSLPHQPDPAATLREMLRILDPRRARLAVAMLSGPDALCAAPIFGAPPAAEHLVERAGGAGRVTVSRIHDVARFDGLAHWWAAVADDTPEHARAHAEERLRPYVAADGTMRIPTEAVLLSAGPVD
jgi:SAM-dependent methyltransferase